MAIVRYATQDDAEKFYGCRPSMSFRGVAIEYEDEIVGLGGIYRNNQMQVAFSDFKEGAHLVFKRETVKAANMAYAIMLKNYWEVFAAVDGNSYPTSQNFIKHFGFEQVGEYLYRWRKT